MQAVIFDLDGVIVDTMNLYFEAGVKVFAGAGKKVSKAQLKGLDAMRLGEGYRKFFSSKSDKEIDSLAQQTYDYLRKKTRGIRPMPGFLEFFFSLRGKYPVAVVSSSRKEFVGYILGELGIKKDFALILGGDDVAQGKPSPEGYLKAAKMLNAKPSQCLVVEDSIFGIKSAKSAGMKCVAVTNSYPENFLLDADLIVDSLAELTLEKAEALFNA